MSIITLATTKGGAGKTTIAQVLARSIHEMGYSVGVESNEPKGSIFYIDVKIHQETSKEVA